MPGHRQTLVAAVEGALEQQLAKYGISETCRTIQMHLQHASTICSITLKHFLLKLTVFCIRQILFYPTAIGSEPQDSSLNSYPHWTRVMCGHAGANLVSAQKRYLCSIASFSVSPEQSTCGGRQLRFGG